MKRTGAKAWVYLDSFDESKMITCQDVSKLTEPNRWYFIFATGTGSTFPYKGSVIKSPASAQNQISLVAGDMIYPLEAERLCKTSASLSMEEGTVDVSDDCDPGAKILDGIVVISGSLAGFFRYNDNTQDFDPVTDGVLNRFLAIVEDDGQGVYEVKERRNGPAFLLINLNSDAKVGQIEQWLFVPAVISSANTNLGNTDVQNKDISFSKGEGEAVLYKVPKAA